MCVAFIVLPTFKNTAAVSGWISAGANHSAWYSWMMDQGSPDELEREDPLFDQIVPVLVRYGDREDRQLQLTVRVLLGTQVRIRDCRTQYVVVYLL